MKNGSQNSTGMKQTDKTTQIQMCANFHEKGRLTQQVKSETQEVEPIVQKVEL